MSLFPRSYRGLNFCESLTDFCCFCTGFLYFYAFFLGNFAEKLIIVNYSVVGLISKEERVLLNFLNLFLAKNET